jgi:hypothetical protein
VDRVVFGIESRFRGGFWEGGFWNTHDALLMMLEMEVDVSRYVPGVLSDISKHTRSGGYDGVIGATCGLLVLLSRLRKRYPEELAAKGFDDAAIKEIVEWIASSWGSQSSNGKQVASLVLLRDPEHRAVLEASPDFSVDVMKRDLRSSLPNVLSGYHDYTAVDLCRVLECHLLVESSDEAIIQIIDRLRELQEPNGGWNTTGRTAAVLVTLLQNWDAIAGILRNTIDLDNMVYAGILHIRSQYDAETSSWHRHFQTTARAVHAIGLYNSLFRHSTQEFFEVIHANLGRMNSAVAIQTSRIEFGSLVDDNSRIRKLHLSAQHRVSELSARQARHDKVVNDMYSRLKWTRQALAVTIPLLLGLVASLSINHRDVLRGLVSELGSALPLIVGAILGVVLAWWGQTDKPD